MHAIDLLSAGIPGSIAAWGPAPRLAHASCSGRRHSSTSCCSASICGDPHADSAGSEQRPLRARCSALSYYGTGIRNLIELTLHHNNCTDAQEQMCCRAPGRQPDPGGFCIRLSAHSVFGAGRQNIFHSGAAGRQVPAEPGPGVCWRLWRPRRHDRDLSASAAPVHVHDIR
jgi:hypothetical protein